MAENAPNHNHMCFTRLSGLCVLDLYVYYIKFNLLFNKNNQQSTAIPPSMHGLGSLYIAINKNGDFGGRNPPLLLKICKSNNQCILSFPILIVLILLTKIKFIQNRGLASLLFVFLFPQMSRLGLSRLGLLCPFKVIIELVIT
jgi:hypothetical protein